MAHNFRAWLKGLFFGLLLTGVVGSAAAQPLDDVSLEARDQGVVATIRLTGPVQYLRHFPESHGKTLEIYYDRVQDASSNEAWLDDEVRRSPPSSQVPSFTVTTRDQQSKPRLVIEFSREAEFSVSEGKDKRSFVVTIRPESRPVSVGALPFLPVIKPESATTGAAAENNKQAHALMVLARDALAAKNNDAAVEAFNKLLLLPPNDYTQDGQEWIGVARERAGQPDKAKVEYDLYLRLYPQGEGAARVAQRLAGVSGKGGASALTELTSTKQQAPTLMSFGSVSSRYYYGRSQISNTNTFNGTVNNDSLSMTDQSMLISTVDISGRYRTEDYDSRLVFRDVNTKNFLSNKPSLNRLNAAYAEVKGRTQNYLLRVGRQSATGGGVLGRFDGLTGSYGDAQTLRVNAVVGALADYSQGAKPRFFGASVDSGAFSLYGITQTLEGITDRRALGAEYRYFDDQKTAYGLLDYDVYFKAVNAAQFMATSKLADSTLLPNAMLTFMLDHRKTPSLSVRNALMGATTSSVSDLLQAMSASSLRDLAWSRTSTSNMGQVGLTVPVHEKWQVGGDVRFTNTTGMAASGQTVVDPVTGLPTCQNANITVQGCVQANPGLGLQKSMTGQVIGSGLYRQGDIWSGSITYSTGGNSKGHNYYLYNHNQFINNLMTMDISLQQSSYQDQYGGTTTQVMPMLRAAYRFKERFTVDGDCGYQKIKYDGPQTSTSTSRLFVSAGLRWDF